MYLKTLLFQKIYTKQENDVRLTHVLEQSSQYHVQGPSWPRILGRSDSPVKLGRSDSQIGRSYSIKLRHFLSVLKQISYYTYYCH